MSWQARRRTAPLPSFLERRATDEFTPTPYSAGERQLIARLRDAGPRTAVRLGIGLGDYWASRAGTAAGLRALNAAWGERFYEVPAEATIDREAADAALSGGEVVIDVQTHFVADRPECARWNTSLAQMYRRVAPPWWKGIDELEAYNLAEYLRCVFVESETAVAILTSAPGLGPDRMLFNREMAGTRELLERLGSNGRLLNHSVVHPEVPGELDAMEQMRDRYAPAGWKVYTLGHLGVDGATPGTGWWLDDEASGVPFLERARELGVRRICAHKGISYHVPTGSPRDVGPAAAAFPDLDFLIYHSGYEMPTGEAPEEGPYLEETCEQGTNRLVKTLRDARIAPGANVYAELGTTWFCLIRRPQEAAHVLGKLLLAVGEDNLLWGTDSCWYGPSQVVIDAFRAFQIPAAYRERWGYPELTPEIKAKILGLNAARLYGIDAGAARLTAERDDLAWLRAAIQEYRAHGVPGAA